MLVNLEISKKNIIENLKIIREINKNLICVLKDNAYGLGIENIVPILVEEGIYNFAVAYEEEGFLIREIFERKYKDKLQFLKILILNYIDVENMEKILEKNLELTIFNFDQLEKYIDIIKKIEKKYTFRCQIKFNIGMNRLGFEVGDIKKLKEKFENLKKMGIKYEITGIYSHVSNGEDDKIIEKQSIIFEKILEELKKNEINYKYKHLQASPLLFFAKERYNYDFARVGMAIYGMEPLSEKIPLKQTIKLFSSIVNIREIKRGELVSYGSKNKLEVDKKIAVVPVGYAHGLQMQMGQKGYVLINGKKAYIVGEICMDMIIVDISHIDGAKIGDEVVFIGKSGNEEITLLQMSKWANTIQDDVMTKLSERIKKKVI